MIADLAHRFYESTSTRNYATACSMLTDEAVNQLAGEGETCTSLLEGLVDDIGDGPQLTRWGATPFNTSAIQMDRGAHAQVFGNDLRRPDREPDLIVDLTKRAGQWEITGVSIDRA
ncbi:hypothetical protein [Luteipulveratus halotolerans]|uniref:Uncharacterized protein n=1 Tax=Luteipulveratus halotolerans TaxID=1631356 RepID=A0A0L6CET6_9MICO|nr:hypothetical protein [Luteipulveratus halotolerans]KNX36080.1 hypothetical protein VV01_01220 [Luteipulveratus halotolerans]